MHEETWKPIPYYPNYQVSDCGRVRRMRDGYILTQQINQYGRYLVGLSHGGRFRRFMVSRLVLMAFVGMPADGMEAAHEDGVPSNNHLSNLAWKTHRENERDKHRHGTFLRGERVGGCRFTERQVVQIRQEYDDLVADRHEAPLMALSDKYNAKTRTVWAIIASENWKHLPPVKRLPRRWENAR